MSSLSETNFQTFFQVETDSKYPQGIMLNIYNGRFSLVAAERASTGVNYMRFCFPSIKKQPADKAIPMGIQLGNSRGEAVRVLSEILAELTNTRPATDSTDDSVPF